jgi:hypothetical protein
VFSPNASTAFDSQLQINRENSNVSSDEQQAALVQEYIALHRTREATQKKINEIKPQITHKAFRATVEQLK